MIMVMVMAKQTVSMGVVVVVASAELEALEQTPPLVVVADKANYGFLKGSGEGLHLEVLEFDLLSIITKKEVTFPPQSIHDRPDYLHWYGWCLQWICWN